MTIDKSKLLALRSTPAESVDLPTGDKLYFRATSAGQRIDVFGDMADGKRTVRDNSLAMNHLIIACACDADGSAVFGAADFDALLALPSDLWEAMSQAAIKANGLNKGAAAEAEKNS